MMSSIVKLTLLSFLFYIESTNAACVNLGELCEEDCDCCGSDTDPGIRCEIRNHPLGRRCYVSGHFGRPCTHDGECLSQHCNVATGRCSWYPHPIVGSPNCPLTFGDTLAIEGEQPDYPAECAADCSVEGSNQPASNAVDGNLATAYANTRALTSGIILHPEENAPIRTLQLCSASDCPQCDPTCYKLEGYCAEDDTYTTVQQGTISFTSRGQCITYTIHERSFYNHYKVTFPCQAASAPECPELSDNCQCDNGLTPFEPVSPSGGTCNGTPQAAISKPIEFISATPVGGDTEIVYRITNPGGGRDSVLFSYAMIQWDNNCCFDCYGAYIDANGDGQLQQPPTLVVPAPDGFDEPCFEQCDSVSELDSLLFSTDDPGLCMTGLKLQNPAIQGTQTYFITVMVKGSVTMVDKTYGVYELIGSRRGRGGLPSIGYGTVKSPVCSCTATPIGECLAYPMQIAEISLTGKCQQFEDA